MTENRDQDEELVQDDVIIEEQEFVVKDDEIVNWDEDQGIPDEQIIGQGSDILASRKKKK